MSEWNLLNWLGLIAGHQKLWEISFFTLQWDPELWAGGEGGFGEYLPKRIQTGLQQQCNQIFWQLTFCLPAFTAHSKMYWIPVPNSRPPKSSQLGVHIDLWLLPDSRTLWYPISIWLVQFKHSNSLWSQISRCSGRVSLALYSPLFLDSNLNSEPSSSHTALSLFGQFTKSFPNSRFRRGSFTCFKTPMKI